MSFSSQLGGISIGSWQLEVVSDGWRKASTSNYLISANLGETFLGGLNLGDLVAITTGSGTVVTGEVVFSGEGDISFNGIACICGTTTFSGVGGFEVEGTRTTYATTVFSGEGNLAANGVRIVIGGVEFSGTGFITSTGILLVVGEVQFDGEGRLIINNTQPDVISFWGGTVTIDDVPVGAMTLAEAIQSGLTLTIAMNTLGLGELSLGTMTITDVHINTLSETLQ